MYNRWWPEGKTEILELYRQPSDVAFRRSDAGCSA